MTEPIFKRKLLPHLVAVAVGSFACQSGFAADDAPGAKKTEVLDVVEVRGIAQTLKRNLMEKRESLNIVDTVTAEDLGKFPDKNAADSLQRVPGISVDRGWGEGREISVRGTDKNVNMTQLNGQAVASGYWWANDKQSRGFNYDILPSEVIGSLEVYKSPSADLDEGSIGGLVIVKTRKPLAFKQALTAQASLEATYSKLPGKTDPQASGLVSWKNADNTVGVLVSLSKQKRTMRRDGLENFTDSTKYTIVDQNGVQTPGAYASWGGGSAIFRQDRDRTTGMVTLQLRPNNRTDLTLNYLNSDMSMNNNNQNYLWQAGGLADSKGVLNVVDPKFITTSDGTKALVGGTLPKTGGVSFEPIYRESYVKSNVLDLEGTYDADKWRAHFQVGSSKGSGGSDHDRNFWFLGDSRVTIDLGPDKYNVKYLDINPLDPKVLTLQNARDWVRHMKAKENYAQADVTYDIDGSAINAVKFGVKLRDNSVQNDRTNGSVGPGSTGWVAYSLADLSTGPSPLLSQAGATSGSLTQYAWLDDGLAASKGFAMYDKGVKYTPALGEYYRITEKITAVYGKAEFAVDKLRGDFGARLVKTKQTSQAYQVGTLGSESRSYTDFLPNLNVVYDLRKDLVIRGSISRVMARQTYTDLTSSIQLDGTTNSATAGNPNLKPVHSNQGEIGAEWYFADASVVSATFFIKKLDTFVYPVSKPEVVDGKTRTVTRPVNADNGADIKGLELQWQQPFGGGFGGIFNYTLTDAKSGSVNGGKRLNVLGNSRDQANASVYYEQGGISLRVSYNYRSKSYGGVTEGGQAVTSAFGQVDASANWDITPKLSLYASGVNLTNELIRTNTVDGLPIGLYENGARYTVGLRAKF